ncbi:MAG TPA: asparagine--tRNA ligase [candidate division Zixibacteria bacterium]|nr:asparagine--tRNA ligase [candidate division Zixibacteria bacterium]
MEKRFYIRDAKDYTGQEVTIRGWVYNKRGHGKVKFLILRDGTGLMQAVIVQGECDDESFARFDELTQESSVIVTGTIREEARSVGGYELGLKSLQIVQIAEEYPIQPKEHGAEFLLDNRHLWLRSRLQWAAIRVRDNVVHAIRDYMRDEGYVLIDTPILTGAIGEESGTLFSVEYFDLGQAYLAQTGQLYLEAAMFAHNKVYDFGPTFRAEKSKTRRHLTEFWMVDVETAFVDNDENMDIQEEFIKGVVQRAIASSTAELEILERDPESIMKSISKPFARLSYDETIEFLKSKDFEIEHGQDIGGAAETILSDNFETPVFIYDYPKAIKAFYMKEHPSRPDLVKCSDLIAPEGYGEIIGGSQREDDIDKLVARIRADKLPEEAYSWYLDLRRYGSVPHAGFGLGVERMVAWMTGIKHVREVIPFPRMIYRLNP